MINPSIPIIILDDFKFNLLGIKLINEYCDGTKFETKFVEIEDTIIKEVKQLLFTVKLSNLPIISLGLVKIDFKSRNLRLSRTSDPITIKTEKKKK